MDTYDFLKSRPEKHKARMLACEYRGITHKSALYLTVPGIPDVKLALKNRVLNKRTKIVVVNLKDSDCCGIRRDLKRAGFQSFKVILGKFESVDLSSYKFDYAFLDFCGNMTPKLLSAVNRINFVDNARVAATICSVVRVGNFVNKYRSSFDGMIPDSAMGFFDTEDRRRFLSDAFNPNQRVSNSSRANFIWQFAAFTAALNRNFSVTDSYFYKENGQGCRSMGFAQVKIKRGKSDSYESIESLLPKPVSRNRSEASKKAWVTIRANKAKKI